MTPKRVFLTMIGSLGLMAVSLIAVLYFGNNMLIAESSKLVDLKATNQGLEQEETGLTKANRDVEKYESLEDITQAIVPRDKDQARAVREIVTLAEKNGIDLKTISFPASNLGTKITPPKTEGGEQQAAPKEANPAISQAKPLDGVKGVYSLELKIEPGKPVSYGQFIGFLADLEKNRRTAQVAKIEIKPQGNVIDFGLTLNIFLKP